MTDLPPYWMWSPRNHSHSHGRRLQGSSGFSGCGEHRRTSPNSHFSSCCHQYNRGPIHTKMRFRPGLHPGPGGGAYTYMTPKTRPLNRFKGALRGRKGAWKEQKEEEYKGEGLAFTEKNEKSATMLTSGLSNFDDRLFYRMLNTVTSSIIKNNNRLKWPLK